MNNTDINIYKAFLELLKQSVVPNVSLVSRMAKVDRKTVRNRIEKYTFQNLEKYKLIS